MAHALAPTIEPVAKKLRSQKRRAPTPRPTVASCHPNDLNRKDKTGKPLTAVIVWRDHLLGPDGPPQPMTRLVLLVLASHMNNEGYAFPSIELLAYESGCSIKSAKRHLTFACAEGWLTRTEGMGYAQGWRRYEYEASLPIFKGGVTVRPRSAWRDVRRARLRDRRHRLTNT
jgi:hypothetical protein